MNLRLSVVLPIFVLVSLCCDTCSGGVLKSREKESTFSSLLSRLHNRVKEHARMDSSTTGRLWDSTGRILKALLKMATNSALKRRAGRLLLDEEPTDEQIAQSFRSSRSSDRGRGKVTFPIDEDEFEIFSEEGTLQSRSPKWPADSKKRNKNSHKGNKNSMREKNPMKENKGSSMRENKNPTREKYPIRENKTPIREKNPIKEKIPIREKNPIRENKTPIREKNPIRENKHPIRENKNPIRENKNPIRENKNPIRENKNPIRENKNPIRENKNPIRENKNPIRENTNPIREDKNPMKEYKNPIRDKTPAKENKVPVKESKNPMKENKNQMIKEIKNAKKQNKVSIITKSSPPKYYGFANPIENTGVLESTSMIRSQPLIVELGPGITRDGRRLQTVEIQGVKIIVGEPKEQNYFSWPA